MVISLDMAPSNSSTERTALLHKDANTVESPACTNGGNEIGTEENGNRGEGEEINPLFEGNADATRIMWLLFPAVSVGV